MIADAVMIVVALGVAWLVKIESTDEPKQNRNQ